MIPEIIPAILVKDAQEAERRVRLVESETSWIQWDVMDGVFVPNTTWAEAPVVARWNISCAIELHLMVMHPERYIHAWHRVPQCRRVIWHSEVALDHRRLIKLCQNYELEVGLALSPHTPVSVIEPFIAQLDTVLIMGVEPGWSGQALISQTLEKVQTLHTHFPNLSLSFDGGVDEQTLILLLEAGCARLAVGSAIFQTADPRRSLHHLQKQANAFATDNHFPTS